MDYTAIGRTNDYYAARKKRNALSKILSESYETGQSVPFVDEDAKYMGQESPEGLVARVEPGQINVKNAIARLAESGDGETAFALQQSMEDRQNKQLQLGQRPSAVQVYEYFKSLPSDQDREVMMRTMRGAQYGEIGGVRNEMPALPGAAPRPLGTLKDEVNAKAAIEGGKEAAKTDAELRTKSSTAAKIDWPKVEAAGSDLLKLTDELVAHKGKRYAVGAASMIPTIPGTSQADFVTRHKQIGGKQFLEAFESLKGGGAITQIEGEKAADSIARMSRAQTIEDFDTSVRDFQEIVDANMQRASKKGGGSYTPRGKKEQKQNIPSGAKKFMDNKTGKEVFTTDGKTYFDAVTGKRVE